MEERQAGRGPVGGRGLDHLPDDIARRNEIAQGQHRPLRLARRARGVEERGDVVPRETGTIDGDIGLSTHLGAGALIADDGQGAELDVMLCGRSLPRLGRGWMRHEYAGFGIGEDVVELPDRRERIDGDDHQPGSVRAEELDEEFRTAGRNEHDPIAGVDIRSEVAVTGGTDFAKEAHLRQRHPIWSRRRGRCDRLRVLLRPRGEQINDRCARLRGHEAPSDHDVDGPARGSTAICGC